MPRAQNLTQDRHAVRSVTAGDRFGVERVRVLTRDLAAQLDQFAGQFDGFIGHGSSDIRRTVPLNDAASISIPGIRLKESSQFLHVADARIFDLLARDFFNSARTDPGSVRDLPPTPLPGLQFRQDIGMQFDVHAHNLDPFSGFRNPVTGNGSQYDAAAMGKRKKSKTPGRLRTVVGLNVRRLMDRKYSGSTNKAKSLAEDADVSLSTIQRVLNAADPENKKKFEDSVGATADTLEAVAARLGVLPYQLLIDGLDIENPQIAHDPTAEEKAAMEHVQRLRAALEAAEQPAAESGPEFKVPHRRSAIARPASAPLAPSKDKKVQ